MNNKMGGGDLEAPVSDVVSKDILKREPIANTAQVKHILIAWKDVTRGDPRAMKRTKADAEKVIVELLDKIKAGANFEALMKEFSEDPGSASTGRAYTVTTEAQLVIEFKMIGMRLGVGELGVVESEFGFHIIKRVE
jgi:parvulin-like peptidyl-prolyl isomerase